MIETFRAYQSVLRLPGISRLLLAACLSRLAGRMFMLAIVLYALDRLRAPSMAGWVAFASMAPGLVISPIAGAWLDRVGAAKAIVMDMMASAVLLLGLVIADVSGAGTTPLLFAIVTTYGLAKPFGNAGVRTMIPHLSPSEMLDRANALDTTIYAVVDILGPACAGVLYGFAGGLVTLTAIAVLFALAGLAVRTLLHLSHTVQSSQASLLSEALAGVKYVLANRSLRGIAVAYSLYQVSWGALLVIVPVIVQGSYGRGPTADTVVGALWTGAGIAGAVGALVTGHLHTTGRERSLIVAGIATTAIAIYPLSSLFGLSGLIVGLIVVGLCAGPVDVGVLSLRQRRTEKEWLGRVLAVSISLNMSGLPIGSALGGIISERSETAALAAAALASAAAAWAAYRLVPMRV